MIRRAAGLTGPRVRRRELEVQLLRDFELMLPPEIEPLDYGSGIDYIRWREEALAEARRELAKAERARWMRRARWTLRKI